MSGEWTIHAWLKSIGLEQYYDTFAQNVESKEDIKGLSLEELKTELGISNLSHRKRIIQYAQEL